MISRIFLCILQICVSHAAYYVTYSDPPLPFYASVYGYYGYLVVSEMEFYNGATPVYQQGFSASSTHSTNYNWINAFNGNYVSFPGASKPTYHDSVQKLTVFLGNQVFNRVVVYYQNYDIYSIGADLRVYDDSTVPHTLLFHGVVTQSSSQSFVFNVVTTNPTSSPSTFPSATPTSAPTATPTTPEPSSLPTAAPSSVPSSIPTTLPTSVPTMIPTQPQCEYQDRNYCNNRGYCKEDGNHCECDDVLHYWPSELCAIYHDGRELAEGQYCYPNAVDFYCSWLGRCNAEGTACDCYDPEHRSSADRCLSWTPEPPVVLGENDTCVPYDRSYCHNRGYCNAAGDACECDDYLHFWPSEKCSTYHDGRELAEGQCCYPDTVDYYCSWMGLCASDGSGCACYDSEHRLPSERCQNWHLVITLPNTTSTECPPLPMEFTAFPSLEPTLFPTNHPTVTHIPTCNPTAPPSLRPSLAPSPYPTIMPSLAPTKTPTLAPSFQPTMTPSSNPSVSPTYAPSVFPTLQPTPLPTYTVCTPYDRSFCHNRGHCSDDGKRCVCDDVLHYWPTERCEYFHDGRELENDQFCFPHEIDYYCSWLGVCNGAGTGCICFDYEHRSSTDRCSTYSPVAPTSPPSTGMCSPGDRTYCNNRGVCSLSGDTCDCDDPLHFWPSERCGTEHYGGELLNEEDCCIPGLSDYYCAWLGECNSAGTGCECFDSDHRLSSERCQYWHESTVGMDDSIVEGECPPLVSILSGEQKDKSSSDSNDDDKNLLHAVPYIVIGCAILAMSVFGIIRWRASDSQDQQRSSYVYGSGKDNFEMESPMYGSQPKNATHAAAGAAPQHSDTEKPRRRSSLNPFACDTYEEVDECEMVSPTEGKQSTSVVVDEETAV